MADILPTGRNFYSVDPQAIPSPAAWKVGVSQGDALLERYLKDEGRYPESVGMVIWGTGTMRTKGDDVAEVLYLMGVRPVWEAQSGRVGGTSRYLWRSWAAPDRCDAADKRPLPRRLLQHSRPHRRGVGDVAGSGEPMRRTISPCTSPRT
jgi:hypothetical protein